MNIPESSSGSSCKRQENGDVSSGSERPLKKARFAWQIKGKYHLKNDIPEVTKPSAVIANNLDVAGSSSKTISDSNSLVGDAEQNLEILGDYLLKQDFNTLDSVIADSDSSLLNPSTSISSESLQYPRYVSSYDNNKHSRNRVSTSNSNFDENEALSMSMVFNFTEDQCIARWQARQMAKGFVDNTINRVLDSWMVAPLPRQMDDNRFLALDVAEFINNLPGDNSIENEGILMAISAHGLQNTSNSNSNSEKSEQNCNPNLRNDIFLSPPTSPIPSDEENVLEPANSKTKESDTDSGSSNELDIPWSYDIKQDVNNVLTGFSIPSNISNSLYFNENEPVTSRHQDYCNDVLTSHEFLDTAVSYAIQNKGLTSFGTDYG